MRKTPLVVLMAALAIGACNKPKTGSQIYQEGTITDTTVVVNTPDTSFYVQGLTGIVLKKFGMNTLDFMSVHTDGIQRNVKLEVAGVPSNMKVELNNASGYTPFATTAMIDVRFLSAGVYPITLTATPDRGEAKVYTVNLRVDSCTSRECNDMFWSGLNSIMLTDTAKEELNTNPTMFFQTQTNGMLYLRNLPMWYNSSNAQSYMTTNNTTNADMKHLVKFSFNCDNGEMMIPEQTVRAIRQAPLDTMMFKVSGKGMVDLENNYYMMTYSSDSATYHMEGVFNY